MDLNTDAGLREVRKNRLSNKTLNTHEIISKIKEPEVGAKKVRTRYEGSAKEVDTFIDAIKVVRIWDSLYQ